MSLLVQRPDVGEFRKRFRWLTLFAFIVFMTAAGRMLELQLVLGDDYAAIARENIVRRVSLATTRGIIRDKNGEVLAASRPAYDMFVEPKRITSLDAKGTARMDEVWRRLVALIGMSDEERQRHEPWIIHP